MDQFRKKPVVIEAAQFTGYFDPALVVAWAGLPETAFVLDQESGLGHLTIPTLEGHLNASPGDWIIRGIKGEFYPCKPDIFDATYERVSP